MRLLEGFVAEDCVFWKEVLEKILGEDGWKIVVEEGLGDTFWRKVLGADVATKQFRAYK